MHATPGPRWFAADSPIGRVHGDAAMFVGGLRALLVQSLHPGAMAGVADHSNYREDPTGRLIGTAQFIAITTYGPIPMAEHTIEAIRAIHGRVHGIRPDGVPYRADDPHLLGWVHAAEVDSFLTAYQALSPAPLAPSEADEYLHQTAQVARRLGVVGAPTTVTALADTLARYRAELTLTPAAAEVRDFLLAGAGAGRAEGPARSMLTEGAITLLPPWAAELLEVDRRPRWRAVAASAAMRGATRGIRWAMAPGQAEARAMEVARLGPVDLRPS